VREFIISDPYERDMYTRILSPSLASHAPNVSRIMLIEGNAILVIYISEGINRTRLNIIPSRHSKDISK